jgi:excisionase family DNA binding protein
LITSNAAAERLGISRATVVRAVNNGVLPAVVTRGGHRRFDPREVERLAITLTLQRQGADLVGSKVAARILGVSQNALNRAARQGRLRAAAITPGGHRRFAPSQLAEAAGPVPIVVVV